MPFRFDYPAEVWAVLPEPDAGRDEEWLDAQLLIAREQCADRMDDARAWAERALALRREGVATSLYFRPPGLPTSGVLHLTFADVVVEDSEFRADDWIPEGSDPRFDPIVSEFETDASPHGYRVAYVSDQRAPDGAELAGIVYGLRFETGLATVFSELSDRETTGLMQWQADPIVASLRAEA